VNAIKANHKGPILHLLDAYQNVAVSKIDIMFPQQQKRQQNVNNRYSTKKKNQGNKKRMQNITQQIVRITLQWNLTWRMICVFCEKIHVHV
jgi:hypothetical protein